MIDYKYSIFSMKKSSFIQALELGIKVFDNNRNAIGKLVPVGDWILDDKEKIDLICSWRQRHMRMFFTQFDSTHEKTFWYLKNLSIAQEGRIFFLLYDSKNQLIGHLGIANVDGKTAELDNLMRGVEGGAPRLVYFAEMALLHWSFKYLSITECYVRVLSYNWLVISLHEEIGFIHLENSPLRKHIKDSVTFHDTVVESESNVRYTCVKMLLQKSVFIKTNSLLYPEA